MTERNVTTADNLVTEENPVLADAAAWGVDLSLLRHNLRLTPTERLERFARALASVRALQAEAEKWRARKRAE